jgi:asparagine synthase (glutamine-hydrolysing)
MCGLFGRINLNGSRVDADECRRMIEIIRHRGPDGYGHYHNDNVYLGQVRLSIIDLEGGKQPIYNEDESCLVICNGEIYNYKQIREELIGKGHIFRTNSDSEVLVHLYEDKKEKMLNDLNGMFSLAIYDIRSEELFLARDRIGIKPLYYYFDGNQFIFSSEMKALIKSGLVPLEIDESTVYRFLTLHHSIPPDTLIKDIKSLKAGHYMVLEGSRIREVQYWDIPQVAARDPVSYESAIEDVENLLMDSVEKRLMSDVPLGLFLSGGVDSSLVAAMMHKIVGDGVKTFSIGFEEKEFSEIQYSRRISDMIRSDHMEIIVTPEDIMSGIEDVVWYRETPISEVSDIPIHLLCRAATQKVTVVLTGEGGDEAFCGYSKYGYEQMAKYSPIFSNPLVRGFYESGLGTKITPQRLKTALRLFATGNKYKRYYRWFSFFRNEELEEIIREDKLKLLEGEDVFEDWLTGRQFRSNVDEMQYLDIKVWLPDNLLLRGDRISMGSSLEARVPFLDHRLVEMGSALPREYKVQRLNGKRILKRIAEKYVPKDVIYRKKVGFEVPIGAWFRGDLKDFLVSSLTRSNSFCSNFLKQERISALIKEHTSGQLNHQKKLWMLLNLELWHDKFMVN